MDDASQIVSRLQARLHGIAYRMLGSISDAEDVVQDVWLRWHDTEQSHVHNAEAWLVATTTRRAIDRLRSARAARENYSGIWLPEPLLTDAADTPEHAEVMNSDLSVALLTLLERLAPETRAAYLMREVFDADYSEIAEILAKSEAACRQMIHRARAQLREQRPRYRVSAQAHRRVLEQFLAALRSGDFAAIRSLLADSAELLGDGGGIVPSFPDPLRDADRIARLLYAPSLRPESRMHVELVHLNGRWGLLRYFDGVLESAQTYDTDGERIVAIQVQRNPHKLTRLLRQAAGDAPD